jgi:hypothetical protein
VRALAHPVGEPVVAETGRKGKRLRSFDLRANGIGDDGARAHERRVHPEPRHLGLVDTLISDDMADALRAHYGPRVLLRE